MISTLTRFTGELMSEKVSDHWRWHGKRVHLIDGTTVTMPDTEVNQSVYPQESYQKAGLGFPICRIVGVICLSSGAVLNAAMGKYNGKGSSEQDLLRTLLDTFRSGDLVLGDAFFGSYFLLATLLDKKIDAVFEQYGARKRVTDFRQGTRLGAKDHLVTLIKPKRKPDWMKQEEYDNAPSELTIRGIKDKREGLDNDITITQGFPEK